MEPDYIIDSKELMPDRPTDFCTECKGDHGKQFIIQYGIKNGRVVLWLCPNCGWKYDPIPTFKEKPEKFIKLGIDCIKNKCVICEQDEEQGVYISTRRKNGDWRI